MGSVEEVLNAPKHEYTKALLASHLSVEAGLKIRTGGSGRRAQ